MNNMNILEDIQKDRKLFASLYIDYNKCVTDLFKKVRKTADVDTIEEATDYLYSFFRKLELKYGITNENLHRD